MDAAEEIPQPGRPVKKPRVDADTLGHSTTKVLDDDNLLREIIVRVGFPTSLVRAALVCKRWLGHVSDPKFLNRFRKLHPPRLLGYYITEGDPHGLYSPRFVPMTPQPPELAAIIHRLESYKFGMHDIMECRNGSVFTRRHGRGTEWTHGVHHPLCAQKGVQFVPPLPPTQDHSRPKFSAIISKQEGSGMSYFYLSGESTGVAGKSTARVYLLQDGEWCMHTSARCPPHCCYVGPKALLMENNIYVPTGSGDDILVLDLTTSSFSTIQLPQGVQYDYFNSMLSWADDASSVYFIHVEEFLLRVWLHKGDNWLLTDTICLHEMLDTLGISDHTLENEDTANVQIHQVGDNGQFVFLRMRQCIFYLDIKCRTLSKVYESTVNDHCFDFHPFMMMWPPIFPALKDDPARKLLDGK